jgi:NADH:ubiquinone oxidoreductase subunit D
LLATWEHRRGRTLTLDGYHASGGVRGAIAETAESVFNDQLNQQQQQLAAMSSCVSPNWVKEQRTRVVALP